MQYYIDVLKKYAVFKGRASRKEYWMFVLFNLIVMILLSLVLSFLGTPKMIKSIISNIYSLAILVPSYSVIIRRLHDIGKSGWWILLNIGGVLLLIPAMILTMIFSFSQSNNGLITASIFGLLGFACIITSFIFAITKSQPGTNKYGPNPYELKTNVVLEPTTPSVPPEQAV